MPDSYLSQGNSLRTVLFNFCRCGAPLKMF